MEVKIYAEALFLNFVKKAVSNYDAANMDSEESRIKMALQQKKCELEESGLIKIDAKAIIKDALIQWINAGVKDNYFCIARDLAFALSIVTK